MSVERFRLEASYRVELSVDSRARNGFIEGSRGRNMTVRWFGLFLAVAISSGAARAAPTIPDPEYLDQLPVGSEIIFEAAIDIPVQSASVEFANAFELPQRNRLSVCVQCKLNLRKESNRVRRIAAGTRLEITQVRRR